MGGCCSASSSTSVPARTCDKHNFRSHDYDLETIAVQDRDNYDDDHSVVAESPTAPRVNITPRLSTLPAAEASTVSQSNSVTTGGHSSDAADGSFVLSPRSQSGGVLNLSGPDTASGSLPALTASDGAAVAAATRSPQASFPQQPRQPQSRETIPVANLQQRNRLSLSWSNVAALLDLRHTDDFELNNFTNQSDGDSDEFVIPNLCLVEK